LRLERKSSKGIMIKRNDPEKKARRLDGTFIAQQAGEGGTSSWEKSGLRLNLIVGKLESSATRRSQHKKRISSQDRKDKDSEWSEGSCQHNSSSKSK